MLSGIGVVCFSASYAAALALEVTRLLFRRGFRGTVMLAFAAAGLAAHTLFLAHRATTAGLPLSSKQDWYLLAAWALAGTYLCLTAYHPRTSVGLFLLPLVLGLVAVGMLLADAEPFARESASRVWGAIHGTSIMAATVSVLVGFAAGLMYLGQVRRLKRKRPTTEGLTLPSLEWLQQTNSRALLVSMVFLGAGMISGTILNVIHHGNQVPWHDPLVVSTGAMFVWLVGAVSLSALYRPVRHGRKVVYLTVFSFLFLLIALAIWLFADTRHVGGQLETARAVEGELGPHPPLGGFVQTEPCGAAAWHGTGGGAE